MPGRELVQVLPGVGSSSCSLCWFQRMAASFMWLHLLSSCRFRWREATAICPHPRALIGRECDRSTPRRPYLAGMPVAFRSLPLLPAPAGPLWPVWPPVRRRVHPPVGALALRSAYPFSVAVARLTQSIHRVAFFASQLTQLPEDVPAFQLASRLPVVPFASSGRHVASQDLAALHSRPEGTRACGQGAAWSAGGAVSPWTRAVAGPSP